MGSTTNDFVEYHVYQLGNLLLEAAYCDVWTLIVLAANGEYTPKADGALAAYQLRDDGLWDSVYHCRERQAHGEAQWAFAYGDAVQIDLAHLVSVADSRLYVQAEARERELDRRFYEIMAAMNW